MAIVLGHRVCYVSMQCKIKGNITETKKSTGIWRHNNRVTTLAKRNIGGLKYEEVKLGGGDGGTGKNSNSDNVPLTSTIRAEFSSSERKPVYNIGNLQRV